MLTNTSILEAVEQFKFTLPNGRVVWAPYLRNDIRNQVGTNQVPRGLGKSAPQEIAYAIEYIISMYPDANEEAIREHLIRGELPKAEMNYKGIDCSGFVYYIYEFLCSRILNKPFSDYVGIPKKDVLNGALNYQEWRDAYVISEREINELDDFVQLTWVAEIFQRKKAGLCGVAGLVSPFTSSEITPHKIAIGDLVKMGIVGDPVSHISVVIDVESDSVKIAHSGRANPDEVGGVCIEKVPLSHDGVDTLKMTTPREYIGIYRPHVLSSLNQNTVAS